MKARVITADSLLLTWITGGKAAGRSGEQPWPADCLFFDPHHSNVEQEGLRLATLAFHYDIPALEVSRDDVASSKFLRHQQF